jgi:hypothetical protein
MAGHFSLCARSIACSAEQDQLGGAGYDPRPIEGLLLTGRKYVTLFPPGEFSFKKSTSFPFEMRKLT